MAEYIDREKLLVAFESKEGAEILHHSIMNLFDIQDFINAQEKADVVEVVRCRECKYLYCLSAIDRRFYCKHYPQGLSGINIVEDNPFCSYGER